MTNPAMKIPEAMLSPKLRPALTLSQAQEFTLISPLKP